MDDIKILREKINTLDNSIVSLLEERFTLSKKIGEYKKNRGLEIYDEDRENAILDTIYSQIKDNDNKENIINIYKTIFIESKKRQI